MRPCAACLNNQSMISCIGLRCPFSSIRVSPQPCTCEQRMQRAQQHTPYHLACMRFGVYTGACTHGHPPSPITGSVLRLYLTTPHSIWANDWEGSQPLCLLSAPRSLATLRLLRGRLRKRGDVGGGTRAGSVLPAVAPLALEVPGGAVRASSSLVAPEPPSWCLLDSTWDVPTVPCGGVTPPLAA